MRLKVNKKCKRCPNLLFTSKEEYLLHNEEEHGKGNVFMCSECGKQYKTKSQLTHHIQSKCGTLKQFKCKVCSQELMSTGSLYNHMLRHKGERSFMCRFCAKLFFTAGQLKVHERIHTQDKPYICEVCQKGFCHRQSLITHSTLHTGIKPFQCENCGNSFSCVGNLIKHRRTHADSCGLLPMLTHRVLHPSTRIKVKINTPANTKLKWKEKKRPPTVDCNVNILNIKTENAQNSNESETKQIGKHIEKENQKKPKYRKIIKPENIETKLHHDARKLNENVNIDDLCNANDKSGHEKAHHEVKMENSDDEVRNGADEKRPNKLQDNENLIKSNKLNTNRNRNTNATHELGKRNLKYNKDLLEFIELRKLDVNKPNHCTYCRKVYHNIPWLYKHENQHKTDESLKSRQYRCSCCKQIFSNKIDCLNHQQIEHADILTCGNCGKIFANRDSLRHHYRIFHNGGTRKCYSYICDKCGKQFRQKSHLVNHEERQCDRGPFYECPTCRKSFATKHTRDSHMRVHDPEKKLLCKFCAKSFHWKGQLKIHERSHTGEKPFTCLYCPKAFAYRESLITHSTIHTGIKPHLCEGCGSRFSCIGNLIKHKTSHASECGAWTYRHQKNTVEQV